MTRFEDVKLSLEKVLITLFDDRSKLILAHSNGGFKSGKLTVWRLEQVQVNTCLVNILSDLESQKVRFSQLGHILNQIQGVANLMLKSYITHFLNLRMRRVHSMLNT